MKAYEIARLLARPVLPVLQSRVRRDLLRLLRESGLANASVLDVGARRSPYTIGLPATITLLDVPRTGEVMERLSLGFTGDLLKEVRRSRSNVARVVEEDMTSCTLPSESFDGVVAVEVIEHVPEDEAFVAQMARVCKRGGWVYLTTPNGDYVRNEPPNYNPDHVRHYRRAELEALLRRHFTDVRVVYGVATGKHRWRGLHSMSLAHPLRSTVGLASNIVNHIESRDLDSRERRTAHLFASARKA